MTSDVLLLGDVLYVGDDFGGLSALDVDSGQPKWHRVLGTGIVGALAVQGDRIYAASRDGNVFAVNAANGEPVWSLPSWRDNMSVTLSAGLTAGDGLIFTACENGVLYALSAADGSVQWTFDAGISLITRPYYHNGVLYLGDQNGIFSALDAKSGRKRWGGGTGGGILTPVVSDETPYFSAWDGTVHARDPQMEATKWNVSLGTPLSTSPTVVGNRVIVGTAEGSVTALSAANGGVLWTARVEGGVISARPTVADGLVFVGNGQGVVSALDLASGALRWSYDLGGEILGEMAWGRGVLFMASVSGKVMAFR
jgi:outer membrane protein assembly factor BamB